MNNLEQEIWRNAKQYETAHRAQWEGIKSSKFDVFYKTIHYHFHNILLPEIKNRNERFVEYWPSLFFWGGRSVHKRSFMDDRAYLYKSGTFATGYLCLSSKTAYIVGLAKMTQQFPLYATGGMGFMFKVLGRMTGEADERQPLNSDKTWAISYGSMLGAEIAEGSERTERLFVRTAVELYHIVSHFDDTLVKMATGMNMGISGKLEAIWSEPATDSQATQAKVLSSEIIETLKKLGDLKDAGVLTDAEFELKKKDLLSRL